MDSLVRSERSPPCEGFPAHRTSVRTLSGVDAPVALQADGVTETLPALGAFVRLLHQVHDPVSLQVAFGFEGLPAGGAAERPRVRVHELVSLQAHFGFERLLADLALEGRVFLLFVSQHVELEGFCAPEFSGALVAGERPPFSVGVHVLQQVSATVKTLLTNFTNKHLRFRFDHRFTRALELRRVRGGKIPCRI